jgi:hypothetical protein
VAIAAPPSFPLEPVGRPIGSRGGMLGQRTLPAVRRPVSG